MQTKVNTVKPVGMHLDRDPCGGHISISWAEQTTGCTSSQVKAAVLILVHGSKELTICGGGLARDGSKRGTGPPA